MRIEDLPPAVREQSARKLRERSGEARKCDLTDNIVVSFTIPLQPVSKKNSRIPKIVNGKFAGLLQSKQYQQYESDAVRLIKGKHRLHIDRPVNVKALYYMKTRGRVDKTNLESALLDVLVAAGVLTDDSALNPEIVVSTDGSRVYYDKDNPRTEIEIREVTQ